MPNRNKPRMRPWAKRPRVLVRAANDSFYNDPVWRATSKAYLAEHLECMCEDCDQREASGKDRLLATMTDHVIPIELGGAEYDHRNFRPMNKLKCHQKKRGQERHGIIEAYKRVETGLIPARPWYASEK